MKYRTATPTDIKTLRKHVEDGVPFVSKPAPRLVVDADVIRELVLHAKAPSGVQISGIAISGTLNLADARGDSGTACNALILEDCVLLGEGGAHASAGHPGLDARHSLLQRLSLFDCRIDGVELSSAQIIGDLNLDGLRPLTPADRGEPDGAGDGERGGQPPCWVKARGARIGGYVTARDATLSLPWQPGAEWPPKCDLWSNLRGPYALDLGGADVGGALGLHPNFVSSGGVNIADATIGGGIWAAGASIEPADIGLSMEALFAQYVQVEGPAFLCDDTVSVAAKRFRAGAVNLYGARISGALVLEGADVKVGDVQQPPSEALNLCSASLPTDVFLRDSKCGPIDIPTIDLSRVNIGGVLCINSSADAPLERLEATSMTVGGDLTLYGTIASTDLSGSTIDGSVQIEGAAAAPIESLTARTLAIGRNLELSGSVSNADFSGSTITGNAEIEGTAESPINTVTATGVKVGGAVTLTGFLAATCDLSGAVIDGDVRLGVTVDDATQPFVLDSSSRTPPVLKLVGASVGSTLKVEKIVTIVPKPAANPRFRTAALLSYPGWRLAEALIPSDDLRDVAIGALLYRPDGTAPMVILTGQSGSIHQFNEDHSPLLEREEQVAQYLSFFCQYVWGDSGAFRVVGDEVRVQPLPPDDPTVNEASAVFGRQPGDGSWLAVAEVEYGTDLYRATFVVDSSGDVAMIADDALGQGRGPEVIYDPPVRRIRIESEHDDDTWPVPSPSGFAFVSDEANPEWTDVQRALRRNAKEQTRLSIDLSATPSIDLRGLRVASLSDGEGKNWNLSEDTASWSAGPKLWLRLGGFEYGRIERLPPAAIRGANPQQRIDRRVEFGETARQDDATYGGGEADRSEAGEALTPEELVAYRRSWLRAQYRTYPPDDIEYRAQPYQQLARVWRAAGQFAEADAIAHDKLELEKVLLVKTNLTFTQQIRNSVSRSLWRLARLFFGFFLNPWRAFAWFAALWLVGVVGMFVFSGVLKIDASAVATVVASDGGIERVVVEEQAIAEPREEVPCGDHISKLAYPLDVMLPLIDLRQESRCQLSRQGHWLVFDWAFVKSLYAVIGWIMLSGFIITLSGVMRRRIEG